MITNQQLTVSGGMSIMNSIIKTSPKSVVIGDGKAGIEISQEGFFLTDHNGTKLSVTEMANMMEIMKRRLLIITPDFEKHEKYPALKEAYENYLVLEKLLGGD